MTPEDFYLGELRAYARSFLGVPYVYAGNNRFSGLDCSGFVCEVLRKYGLVGPHEDLSAEGLYDKLKPAGTAIQKNDSFLFPAGTILFYGNDEHNITHVAMVMDWYSIIQSGGGSARVDSIDKAHALGAQVNERSIRLRSDVVAAILPKYPWAY